METPSLSVSGVVGYPHLLTSDVNYSKRKTKDMNRKLYCYADISLTSLGLEVWVCGEV